MTFQKRLHGAKLDGAKHFQKNCQNVPGAVGAAVGAGAASAVCIYYVIIGGRFAPPYKYMVKSIQQKQQQSSRGSSIEICFGNSFSLTSLCLGMLYASLPNSSQLLTSLAKGW